MTPIKRAILISMKDNVATVLAPVQISDSVLIMYDNDVITDVCAVEDIAMYHKIAIEPIQMGANVYKYGEAIGKARDFIYKGQHVHIHNIGSLMIKK